MKNIIRTTAMTLLTAILCMSFGACDDGSSGNNSGDTPITVPAAPGAATLVPADSQLTAQWTAVNGAADYEVWYSQADDVTTAAEFTADADSTDLSCVITGLSNTTEYYVWLRAKNSAGTSQFGPVAIGFTPGWYALDDGVNGMVHALAFDASGDLYAGCMPSRSDPDPDSLFRWDGSSWSGLIPGNIGTVMALAFDGSGNLYAGGMLPASGENPLNTIVQWDGTSWSVMSDGIDGVVYALAFDGSGNLYAGGSFSAVEGIPANNIAMWDGASWSALGDGAGSGDFESVLTLAFDDSGNLYAGGSFSAAGGIPANNIAMWDGASWSALGEGVGSGVVGALAFDDSGSLYAGGSFSAAGGNPANNIAMWNGSSWSALGDGTDYLVLALAFDASDGLYAGGMFPGQERDDVTANTLRLWDGSSWSEPGVGVNNAVNALVVDSSGNLYAGGRFTTAGGAPAVGVARYVK